VLSTDFGNGKQISNTRSNAIFRLLFVQIYYESELVSFSTASLGGVLNNPRRSNMLEELNQYAQLINFVLLATIITWLFRLSQLSRTALLDKHTTEISAKDAEINHLNQEVSSIQKQYDRTIAELKTRFDDERQLWQLGRESIERIGTLPPEERIVELNNYRDLVAAEIDKQAERKKVALEQEMETLISSIDVTKIAELLKSSLLLYELYEPSALEKEKVDNAT